MRSQTHYDIIGDIHGQYHKLKALMECLGYKSHELGFSPPEGHQAIFLGDLIDPKPGFTTQGGVKSTLEAVKAMCDRGDAQCIMGNHELNAIYYHSKGDDDEWLRERSPKNVKMHKGTLDDFPCYGEQESDWQQIWMPWMKALPFYLEEDGFRVIHASWHPELIKRLNGRDHSCPDFFQAAADPSTPEGEAMEILLKGVEIKLPDGVKFKDHTDSPRYHIRVRWWELPASGITYDQLVYPANPAIPSEPVREESFDEIQGYGISEPPVFFGHYLKPAINPPAPERNNVACLDYSAAKSGPLVAYRWQGEEEINPHHYVCSTD